MLIFQTLEKLHSIGACHRPPPDLAYVHRAAAGKSVDSCSCSASGVQAGSCGLADQYSQFCDLYLERASSTWCCGKTTGACEKMFKSTMPGQRSRIVPIPRPEVRSSSQHRSWPCWGQQLRLEATGKPESSVLDRRSCTGRGVRPFGGTTRVVIPDNTRTAVSPGLLLRTARSIPQLCLYSLGGPLLSGRHPGAGTGLPGTREKSNLARFDRWSAGSWHDFAQDGASQSWVNSIKPFTRLLGDRYNTPAFPQS